MKKEKEGNINIKEELFYSYLSSYFIIMNVHRASRLVGLFQDIEEMFSQDITKLEVVMATTPFFRGLFLGLDAVTVFKLAKATILSQFIGHTSGTDTMDKRSFFVGWKRETENRSAPRVKEEKTIRLA